MAARAARRYHYLHRKPPISYAFGLIDDAELVGICTFGTPPSRHLQVGVCPTDPALVVELNRLWVDDRMPTNTESWFVARALGLMPPRIVVSYADPVAGHVGMIYRALNFNFAGMTDADRATPRLDYMPIKAGAHTREATRSGVAGKVRRVPKYRYWITTGNRQDRRKLAAVCRWPSLPYPRATFTGDGSDIGEAGCDEGVCFV